jgi:hypothetical protein
MDRMAQRTRQPDVLQELFEALGNDPFVIAECLARPALAERLLTNWSADDRRSHREPLESSRVQAEDQASTCGALPSGGYKPPEIVGGNCNRDTWRAAASPPDGRDSHTVVWTGSEMIVWGGGYSGGVWNTGGKDWERNGGMGRVSRTFSLFNTGGRYNPKTDT